MLPRYLRLGFGFCVAGMVLNFVLAGWHISQGRAPLTDLVRPFVMGVLFAWAFSQCTKD